MNKAIFLDRDGTINVEKQYLYKIEDFEFLPGAVDALKLMQSEGFKIIIITNQSGIARGFYSETDFLLLNEWMVSELGRLGVVVDKVYYCPHHPEAQIEKYKCDCTCRKPKIGLFEQAINDFQLDVSKCYAIGDKERDCSICLTSDCKGFLIENNEKQEIIDQVKNGNYKNIRYANSLIDAALIISETGKRL